jgi:hypothetical protein
VLCLFVPKTGGNEVCDTVSAFLELSLHCQNNARGFGVGDLGYNERVRYFPRFINQQFELKLVDAIAG